MAGQPKADRIVTVMHIPLIATKVCRTNLHCVLLLSANTGIFDNNSHRLISRGEAWKNVSISTFRFTWQGQI